MARYHVQAEKIGKKI